MFPTTREFPKKRPPTWDAVAPGYYVTQAGTCLPTDPNNIPSSPSGGRPPNMAPMPDDKWVTDKIEESLDQPWGHADIKPIKP